MTLTLVLTDTHGCKRATQIAVARGRRLGEKLGRPINWVFLGDYVDRGPNSKGMIDLVRDMQQNEDAVCLAGNHDVMFASAILADDPEDWLYNGALQCARSYGYFDPDARAALRRMREDEIVIQDCEWLLTLPLIHQDEHRIFVHAGIDPYEKIENQRPFDLIWIRDPFLNFRGEFPKRVVHGHSRHYGHPNSGFSNRTNLDTGIAYGRTLTMGVFTDKHPEPLGFMIVTQEDVAQDEAGEDVIENLNFNRLGSTVPLD